MTYIRFLAFAGAIAVLTALAGTADAGGSWGGSSGGWGGSSGGSSGGGLLSRWKARHSGSHGSSGGRSWGSSGGSWGGSSGGASHGSSGGSSGGRVGPLKRLVAKIHARKSHGSSGGSHGSHGGSRGHGSSGGYVSYASHSAPVHTVSMGATSTYESPVIQSSYNTYTPMGETIIDSGVTHGTTITDGVPIEGTTLEGGSLGTETIIDSARHEVAKPAVESDAAMLTVAVPGGAKVTVNGHPTTSDGAIRQFMSRGLKEGFVYTYVVKATFEVDGQEKTESKSVKLRPGDTQRVEFKAPAKPVQPEVEDVVTVVKLHVPADAQVTLAGNATNGRGSVRTFRTKQLKAGQQWAGYTIRVTAVFNGQPTSQERTIDVIAGSTNELTFDFNNNTVAIR